MLRTILYRFRISFWKSLELKMPNHSNWAIRMITVSKVRRHACLHASGGRTYWHALHEAWSGAKNVAAWWELRSNETTRNHKWVAKGTFDTHIFVWFKYAGLSVWSLVRTGPENLCVSTAALFLIIHGLKQIPRACSIFDEAIVTLQNGWYTRFIKFFNGKGYFFEGAQ